MVNGTNGLQLAGLVFMPSQQMDARAELQAWEVAITDLDQALADLAGARAMIDAESNLLDRLEASRVLSIEGPNAEARKARLTLELADDARYQTHLSALRQARERLADADRRVAVARERCRLLRAALTVQDRAA
ncbi:MAG: hypothetical protein AB7R89_34440 [Dehalococcoidia bacterium]